MSPLAGRAQSACAWVAIASALLAPFAFGASTLKVWVPLAFLWAGLGLVSLGTQISSAGPGAFRDFNPAPGVLVALHALMAFQSMQLPAAVLRVLSPGSFAAHFIPGGESTLAPLTASPTGTVQAWLFISGLHGLVVAIFSAPPAEQRRRLRVILHGIAAVTAVLALEGLVQSRSEHPFRLYGTFEVPGAEGHERGIFGPYYNRDHYANLMAIGGSVVAAMLGQALGGATLRGFSSFVNSAGFFRTLALVAAQLIIIVACAAAGSRGGLIALAVGLTIGLGPLMLARPRFAIAAGALLAMVLFGAGIPSAFMRLADVDFEASRAMVWRDMLRVVSYFPIFGCGIGAFAVAYWPYQRVVRFEYWPHAHNEYLQWLLEAGAVGVLIALYVMRKTWIASPRLARSLHARPALVGLTAALVHSAADCVLRIPANAAWAAILLAGAFLAISPAWSKETAPTNG
jgi:O-antigen ligase